MTTYTTPQASFESTLPDGALGPEVETDHDRPPLLATYIFGPTFDGTLFALVDKRLFYCKPKQPEYWPLLYYIEVSVPQFPLITGLLHNSQVYVLTEKDIYYIQGSGHGAFLPLKRDAKTGAQSIRGALSVTGQGIYHVGHDGIYLFSGSNDQKITETTLDPIFRGETVEELPGVSTLTTSFLWQFKNHLYFGYASLGHAYPTNVLVMNLDSKKVVYYIYNDGADVEIRAITTDLTNKRLLLGDATGFVREAEIPGNTDDSGTAIPFDSQSKDYQLQTRSHFPVHAKYDVDASNAEEVTGEILLDGVSHQTHTITGPRNTKRRLITTGNGERVSIRISGSGPASIYLTEVE